MCRDADRSLQDRGRDPERLVLRQKKIAYLLGGLLLRGHGIRFPFFAGLAARRKTSAGIIAVDVIGLLIFVGGVALIRAGIRNKSRIIFDRGSREVRFNPPPKKRAAAISFDSLPGGRHGFRGKEPIQQSKRPSQEEIYRLFKSSFWIKAGRRRRSTNRPTPSRCSTWQRRSPTAAASRSRAGRSGAQGNGPHQSPTGRDRVARRALPPE